MDDLLGEAKRRAKAKAPPNGVIYSFPRCGSGIGYGVDSQEINAWEMAILLAESAAGMIGQKAAEGHCTTNAPCPESSAGHLEMLEDFGKALHGVASEVDDLIVKIKASKVIGEQSARDLGLRD